MKSATAAVVYTILIGVFGTHTHTHGQCLFFLTGEFKIGYKEIHEMRLYAKLEKCFHNS